MKIATTFRLDEDVKAVSMPASDDWLGIHNEKGQSLYAFKRTIYKAVPDAM